MWAARFNENKTGISNQEVISILLKAGASVADRDENGLTPLMYAARFNENPEIITILLQAGSSGKIKDSDGKTAFDYAKTNEALKSTAAYWALNDARF